MSNGAPFIVWSKWYGLFWSGEISLVTQFNLYNEDWVEILPTITFFDRHISVCTTVIPNPGNSMLWNNMVYIQRGNVNSWLRILLVLHVLFRLTELAKKTTVTSEKIYIIILVCFLRTALKTNHKSFHFSNPCLPNGRGGAISLQSFSALIRELPIF